MSLNNFIFTNQNHFIAIEKHSFFRSSIYLVLLEKGYMIGLELNKRLILGEIPSLFKKSSFCNIITEPSNPLAYLDEKLVNDTATKYLYDASIFGVSKYNFRIHVDNISAVDYIPSPSKEKRFSSFTHTCGLNIRTTHGDCNISNNRPVNKSFTGRCSLQNEYNKSINIGYKELVVISDKATNFLQFFSNKPRLDKTTQSSTNNFVVK